MDKKELKKTIRKYNTEILREEFEKVKNLEPVEKCEYVFTLPILKLKYEYKNDFVEIEKLKKINKGRGRK